MEVFSSSSWVLWAQPLCLSERRRGASLHTTVVGFCGSPFLSLHLLLTVIGRMYYTRMPDLRWYLPGVRLRKLRFLVRWAKSERVRICTPLVGHHLWVFIHNVNMFFPYLFLVMKVWNNILVHGLSIYPFLCVMESNASLPPFVTSSLSSVILSIRMLHTDYIHKKTKSWSFQRHSL